MVRGIMTSIPNQTRHRDGVYLLFFLSGMTGLIYEVLWVSRFGRLFGSSSYAISTVLAAYMGGLALGSYLLGKRADHQANGLRIYAWLEILIAVTALLVGPLLFASKPLYIWVSATRSPLIINVTRLVVSLVVLLPPTLCMGGTLPVLVRHYTHQSREAGPRLGGLYALNTFGAVSGTLLAGLVLLPAIGERYTLLIAVLINLFIFVTAWRWSRTPMPTVADGATAPPKSATPEAKTVSGRNILLLAALATAGFASMGFEIAWSRVIALLVGSSVYAFTAMLGVFLAGLAAGAALAGYVIKRRGAHIRWFVMAETGVALWLLLTLPHYDDLAVFIGIFNQAAQGHFQWILIAIFLVCMFIMLPPAMLMGSTIPFIMAVVNRGMQVGRYTGVVYACNTVGGIVGSLVSGFLLVPLIGVQTTLLFCVTLNLLAAALSLAPRAGSRPLRSILWTVILISLGIITWHTTPWDPIRMTTGAFLYGPQTEFPADLVFNKDGVSCTVTVEEYADGSRTLRVNGKADASTDIDMANQLMTGLLGMFHKQDARRVLVIGYGSGVSVGAIMHYDVASIDCAELERRVIEADPFFHMVNHRPLADPRLTIFVEDGRNIIETTRQSYDVIVSEPSNPWMAGIAALFTREYYEKCRKGLSPGGVMCQWLQAYSTSLDDFKTIARTFGSVFPHHAMYRVSTGDFLLLGSDQPLIPNLQAIQRRILTHPPLRQDLRMFCSSDDIRALLVRYFIFGGASYDAFCKDAPILRDYHNTLEYSAVRNLFTQSEEASRAIEQAIYSHKNQILPRDTALRLTGKDRDLSAAFLDVAEKCFSAGNIAVAQACYEWALRADPDNEWAHAGLLRTALLTGQDSEQIAQLTARVSAAHPSVGYTTCRRLFEAGQVDTARIILEQMIERYPDSSTLKIRLASALANLDRPERAMSLLQKLHAEDPLNEEVQSTMLLFEMNRPGE